MLDVAGKEYVAKEAEEGEEEEEEEQEPEQQLEEVVAGIWSSGGAGSWQRKWRHEQQQDREPMHECIGSQRNRRH